MSSRDTPREFSSPLPVYYNVKDNNGESLPVTTRLPLSLHQSMVQAVRNTEFTSHHNLRMNCIVQGFKIFQERGQLDVCPEVFAQLELEETRSRMSRQNRLLRDCRKMLRESKTRAQWNDAVRAAERMAAMTTDPDIALQIRQLLAEPNLLFQPPDFYTNGHTN